MKGGEVVFAIALSEKLSETIPVNENSIAQLVGYDKDGKEVYEGDFIIEHSGDVARVDYHDNPAYIKLCKLKEAAS